MSRNIPNRWLPYKACGEVIEGTRIICFKVPLRTSVQKGNKEIAEIWDVKSVLNKIPGLKAIIDLTNTAKYYNPQDFEEAGVKYRKIMMAGRVIPPNHQVKEFMDELDYLLKKYKDSVIGVHCTHGLNRTGFMVCRYMRDRLGIEPREAIKRFEKARGYEIERENYIADILGKNPPPPVFGHKSEADPVPVGKDRSRSLSTYGEERKEHNKTHEEEYRTSHRTERESRHKESRSQRSRSPRSRSSRHRERRLSYNREDRQSHQKEDKTSDRYQHGSYSLNEDKPSNHHQNGASDQNEHRPSPQRDLKTPFYRNEQIPSYQNASGTSHQESWIPNWRTEPRYQGQNDFRNFNSKQSRPRNRCEENDIKRNDGKNESARKKRKPQNNVFDYRFDY